MDFRRNQTERGPASAPSGTDGDDGDGLLDLSVLVSVPPGRESEQRGLLEAIEPINAMASWRYLTRFRARGSAAVTGQMDATLPVGMLGGDARGFDVVLGLVHGDPPVALARLSRAEIEQWQAHGPWLVLIEELHPEPARDAATMRYRNALRSLIDWAATQPRVIVTHRMPSEDLGAAARHVLADLARRVWMERNRVDRLVCRQCGWQMPFERSTGRCQRDGSVMVQPALLERRRVPSWIGEFPIHGVVGRGAFGRVWLSMSEHREWGALKTLVDASDGHAIARLHRELDLLSAIEHPHIVRVLDRAEVDGTPVGLLEYLPGRPLKFVVDALPPRQVLDLMVDLLSALESIHRGGIVHRDLKPGNIMLVDDPRRPADPPRLVLLDFGLGKHQVHAQEGLTKHGMVLGTPNYMAPEQFLRASTVDARADLYAVGAMLYLALTPDKRLPVPPPERLDDPVALVDFITRVQTAEPTPIGRGDIPADVQAIVMRALARSPDDRFPSAGDMRHALLQALDRWDDATIDQADRSWTRWSPSAAYVGYHAQGRSSAMSDVTVSSESLPVTLSSSPHLPIQARPGSAPRLPPPPSGPGAVSGASSPSGAGRGGFTAVLDEPSVPGDGAAPGPSSGPRPAPARRTAVDDRTRLSPPVPASGGRRAVVIAAAVALVAAVAAAVVWVGWPRPLHAVVAVHAADGSALAGVQVTVGGGASATTDDRGQVRLGLGPRGDGPWTVTVTPPDGLAARDAATRQLAADAADEAREIRLAFELFNPYAVLNPGGSLIPVELGDGFLVTQREVTVGALLPAGRAGLLVLPAGTELHGCQGEPFVGGGTTPDRRRIERALERCIERHTRSRVELRLRRPGDGEPVTEVFTVAG